MNLIWFCKLLKVNKQFRSSIVWTIYRHKHILLIDDHGDIIFPKSFDLLVSNPNSNRLYITDKIISGNNAPINFYG